MTPAPIVLPALPPPVIRRPRAPMPAVPILPLMMGGVRYPVTKWRVA